MSDSHLYDRPLPALGLSALDILPNQGKNEWEWLRTRNRRIEVWMIVVPLP